MIDPKFDSADPFREGLAQVKNEEETYGFVDKDGEEQICFDYVFAYDFHEGLALVKKKENATIRWGYIDMAGRMKKSIQCEKAGDFHDGMAWIKIDGKYGYVKKQSQSRLALDIFPEYDLAYDFHEGLAKVELDGKYGYIDKDGNAVTEIIYDIA